MLIAFALHYGESEGIPRLFGRCPFSLPVSIILPFPLPDVSKI